MARRDELKEIEQNILGSALQVVSHVMDFAQIDPTAEAPPEVWIEEMGEIAAWKRWRVARAGWVSAKEAPVGIKVATQIASAGIKAHAERVEPRRLNVNLITVQSTDHLYEVLEVGNGREDDD